jgi:PIN domain nuclease of toxin-antitoxin system
MAIEAVVDSSAFLAHAFGESGAPVAEAVFPVSAISTVNLTEIVTSMFERSWATGESGPLSTPLLR